MNVRPRGNGGLLPLVSASRAAEMIGVHRRTVYRWIEHDRVPSVKVEGVRRLYLPVVQHIMEHGLGPDDRLPPPNGDESYSVTYERAMRARAQAGEAARRLEEHQEDEGA